jgi:hypothetical protein
LTETGKEKKFQTPEKPPRTEPDIHTFFEVTAPKIPGKVVMPIPQSVPERKAEPEERE